MINYLEKCRNYKTVRQGSFLRQATIAAQVCLEKNGAGRLLQSSQREESYVRSVQFHQYGLATSLLNNLFTLRNHFNSLTLAPLHRLDARMGGFLTFCFFGVSSSSSDSCRVTDKSKS